MGFSRKYLIRLLMILSIGLHVFPAAAWNQLPLLTDSPRLLPAGQVQFDVGLQFLSRQNFPFLPFSAHPARDVLSLPTLGLNFGFGKRVELQLRYEVLFVEEEELRIKELWKSGDLAFFTKINILEEHRRLPGIGVKLGAKLPNTSDAYRVGTNETDLAFLALFEKTFAAFTTTANLGLLILSDPFRNVTQDDLLSYGVACTFPWKPNLTYTAEVAGQAGGISHNERASAVLHLFFQNGALTWNLATRVGLHKNSENWGVSGGVRWTFDWLKRWASDK